jgi:molecular chaperone GrpE
MSRNYYDPTARRRTAVQRGQGQPSLDDYRALQAAYEKLRAEYERQSKKLAEVEQELQIKNEALGRQNADLKNLEAELVWAKAALQQEGQSDTEEIDWEDRYTRLQAEVENMRKRWEQRFATETADARHRILLDMLPLADHLELALNHADSDEAGPGESFVDNIRATQRAFLDTLRRYGVSPIEAKGQPFDPNLHEAVGQIASDEYPEGVVAVVIQTGYREGEQLLRPARVLVSAGAGN